MKNLFCNIIFYTGTIVLYIIAFVAFCFFMCSLVLVLLFLIEFVKNNPFRGESIIKLVLQLGGLFLPNCLVIVFLKLLSRLLLFIKEDAS